MNYRSRVLALLFLLSIITYMDRVCIGLAGKRIQADLGLNESQLGWVLGIFALSYAAFEIPSGAMGDRIGPRTVLMRIVLWWSAFTSLTGVVSGFWAMLGVRFAFGAGEAGAYPNSSSAISRWFPDGEASARAWHGLDGQPSGWGNRSVAGRTHPGRLRMEGIILGFRICRRGLVDSLVRLVSGSSG